MIKCRVYKKNVHSETLNLLSWDSAAPSAWQVKYQ